jgi:hypothetical protein
MLKPSPPAKRRGYLRTAEDIGKRNGENSINQIEGILPRFKKLSMLVDKNFSNLICMRYSYSEYQLTNDENAESDC